MLAGTLAKKEKEISDVIEEIESARIVENKNILKKGVKLIEEEEDDESYDVNVS